jgi:hypothetical protein
LDEPTIFNVSKLELLRQQGFLFQRIPTSTKTTTATTATVTETATPETPETPEQNPGVFISASARQKRLEKKWNERADQLREYRDEYGHSDPSNKETEKYKGLSSWVIKWRTIVQRTSKQQHQQNQGEHAPTPDSPLPTTATTTIAPAQLMRLLDLGITTTRNKTIKLERAERQWERSFDEMKQFQEKTGHTVVPEKSNPSLRTWLVTQRKEYAKLINGEPNQMTTSQLNRLTAIGFAFEARPKYTFDERFHQWIQYKQAHDGKDPTSKDAVGKWICKTRLKYHAKMAGQPSFLTDGQIERLISNGFLWSRQVNKTETLPWDECFDELCGYQSQNGTTVVPQNMTGLGRWVHKQRCRYQKYLGNESGALSKDRIDKLNSINFCWVVRKRSLKRPMQEMSSDDDDDDDEEEEQEDQEDLNPAGPPSLKRYKREILENPSYLQS